MAMIGVVILVYPAQVMQIGEQDDDPLVRPRAGGEQQTVLKNPLPMAVAMCAGPLEREVILK
jgi:hypothetical protein